MAHRLAHPVPNVRMLQMENAALIDGLRALNEQVKKLEQDRNRLLEAGAHLRSVAYQEMVDYIDPHSLPTQGSGEKTPATDILRGWREGVYYVQCGALLGCCVC